MRWHIVAAGLAAMALESAGAPMGPRLPDEGPAARSVARLADAESATGRHRPRPIDEERRRGPGPQDLHGRPELPIAVPRSPRETEDLAARRLECARLAASVNASDRQQASIRCPGNFNRQMLPGPPVPVPAPNTPTPVTACDPGGCWDTSGVRYNGPGPMMLRGDGKLCQQIGHLMHCPP